MIFTSLLIADSHHDYQISEASELNAPVPSFWSTSLSDPKVTDLRETECDTPSQPLRKKSMGGADDRTGRTIEGTGSTAGLFTAVGVIKGGGGVTAES
jgi:hypothetical protein